MATMEEIARKAGVSKMTVSRILNNQGSRHSEKTVAKVLAAAKKSSYYIDDMARAIKTGKSKAIGFISYNLGDDIASGVIEKASELNYPLRLIKTPLKTSKQANEVYEKIVRERLCGIIIHHNLADLLENILIKNNVPFVYIGPRNKPEIKLKVSSDLQRSSDLIMERLYDLGHRKIAFCMFSIKDHASYQRMECFKKFMQAKKLDINNAIFEINESALSKQRFMKFIHSGSRPTAVIGAAHTATVSAVTAIESSGLRIPQDISVISYRDSEVIRNIVPAITAIAEKNYKMGARAAKMLIERISCGECLCRHDVFGVELIDRKSCAPPPESTLDTETTT